MTMVRFYVVRLEGENDCVIVPDTWYSERKTFYSSKKPEEAVKNWEHVRLTRKICALELISRHGNSMIHAPSVLLIPFLI